MAQIPGLPIDEPVARPKASPGEFASPGATVAQLGQETEQLALGNQAFEAHLYEAQRYLKYKQVEIAVGQLENQAHEALNKTTSPEDAQAVHAQFKQQVDDALGPYMADKQLARQLHIYGQQVDVQMQSTVNARKATIIQHSDQAANEVILTDGEHEAINDWVGGGDPSVARAKVKNKLDSSVHVIGTMTQPEEDAIMQKFDKDIESGYIDAQLNSSNLQIVQNTVTDLRLHPEKYPHLDKGELNALADKGERAVASRLSLQDEINAKAEEKQYWNQSPTGIPKMFTDTNGNFDEEKALSYVASLGLSPEGEKALIGNVKTHGAAANYALKRDSVKLENDIVQSLSGKAPDYKKADDLLSQYKVFTEKHPEFGDAYKSLKTYEYAQQEHARSEALYARGAHNEEVRLRREQDQYNSFDLLGQLGPAIQRGEYSDTQLRAMTGKGKGKLFPAQVDEAIKLSHSMETDPENRPYISSIWNDTAIPTAVQGEVITEFHDFLRKHPQASGTEKAAEVKRLTDPARIETINNAIDGVNDRLNGKPQQEQQNVEPVDEGYTPIQTTRTGDIKFTEGNKTYHIPPDMVDEFKRDHPNAR